MFFWTDVIFFVVCILALGITIGYAEGKSRLAAYKNGKRR
jgi:hypothetical protein